MSTHAKIIASRWKKSEENIPFWDFWETFFRFFFQYKIGMFLFQLKHIFSFFSFLFRLRNNDRLCTLCYHDANAIFWISTSMYRLKRILIGATKSPRQLYCRTQWTNKRTNKWQSKKTGAIINTHENKLRDI